ncbi:MAG: 7TM-DISM domain-containing protein [Propionivibrio sp.]
MNTGMPDTLNALNPTDARAVSGIVSLPSCCRCFASSAPLAARPRCRDRRAAAARLPCAPSTAVLVPEIAVLVNEGGGETIESVAGTSASRFRPLGTPLSAGYTRKAHWLRVSLRREAATPLRWLLELGPGYLDDVRLYTPDAGAPNGFRKRLAGDRLPFAAREVAHRLFVFLVDLPDGNAPCTLYLRLQSTSTLMAHLTFWELRAFATATQGEYLVLGVLLGALCLMLLYSATYWYFLRERYLLLFVGLVLAMLIAHFGTNGLAEQFLFRRIRRWPTCSRRWGRAC